MPFDNAFVQSPKTENNNVGLSEQNKIAFTNNSFSERNDKQTEVKKRKSKKTVFGFVFLLAAIAIVFPSIYIPVFSDVFVPKPEQQDSGYVEYVQSISFNSNSGYLEIHTTLKPGFEYTYLYYKIKTTTGDLLTSVYNYNGGFPSIEKTEFLGNGTVVIEIYAIESEITKPKYEDKITYDSKTFCLVYKEQCDISAYLT